MGLFKHWRKEKEYTLAEALEELKKKENFNRIPVPTRPGSLNTTYWLREEKREEDHRQLTGVTNSILRTEQESPSAFEQRRDRFMSEVKGNGQYRKLSHDIHESSSSKRGRVVPSPSYNDWKSTKNYNPRNQWGQYR